MKLIFFPRGRQIIKLIVFTLPRLFIKMGNKIIITHTSYISLVFNVFYFNERNILTENKKSKS